ncbi:uncharacterized protein LOC9327969 [Arabidopsis lyrata subsp. lyrata]|uniref:uncharacterized protein LOC9327969 n=1 Tax=Arabidopsis lyrata subsp. lyrata TaxID=81972 RepID=UPI000A29C9DC|nr:uncharacterized protein LOC9327969 [Arabidopsis lyrata subsp. lyrata]|eukprot:XP_020866656.1 uncharacterized protein LOC9327969 [Arabidopsis lyrata subsp. lyrata]
MASNGASPRIVDATDNSLDKIKQQLESRVIGTCFWDLLFKRAETEASTIRRHQDKNLKPRRIKSTSASMQEGGGIIGVVGVLLKRLWLVLVMALNPDGVNNGLGLV